MLKKEAVILSALSKRYKTYFVCLIYCILQEKALEKLATLLVLLYLVNYIKNK
jgi:hypothetical protein